MLRKIQNFLYEPKSQIGWVHGFIACFGAVLLSYLSTMILSTLLIGDFAQRIIPSMILTPILMSFWGIWILFSKTRYLAIKKFILALILLFLTFITLIKVF